MKTLTDIRKETIDKMTYEQMLLKWRFAPVGDPIFQGEIGRYFKESMLTKKRNLSENAQVEISKKIGWEQRNQTIKIFSANDVRDAYLALELLKQARANGNSPERQIAEDTETESEAVELLLRLRCGQEILKQARLMVSERTTAQYDLFQSPDSPILRFPAGYINTLEIFRQVALAKKDDFTNEIEPLDGSK